jgi:hypothetical protein
MPSKIAPILLVLVGLLAVGPTSAVELRDAELVAGGSPVLQNAGGTVRLEGARLGRVGPTTFVPEPGALWQIGSGIGLLALLAGRRRRAHAAASERTALMMSRLRSHASWVAILVLTLLAWPAVAQVPQDTTFTGRLLDDLGDPLPGPVNLELRVFDAQTGPTQLYSEQHLGVALDATGGFSVQLGLGTSPSGTFDADLFSDVNRWLEVVVGAEVLTPRQIIGSVPWALIAQQANALVRDPNAPRFEDCGDGTVADHQWGLQWEAKTGTLSSPVTCETAGCPDPHDVNNLYKWSDTGTDPDGGAFTDFLAKLNDPVFGDTGPFPGEIDPADDPTGCFAGYCDWRLPIIAGEMRTIMIGPDAAPGQDTTCPVDPCIDPGFAAVGGPTASRSYWSASTVTGMPTYVWQGDFLSGVILLTQKVPEHPPSGIYPLRAVRAGSCN